MDNSLQFLDSLRCPRCGELRVVYYLKIGGRHAILKAMCPNDRSKKAFRLPLEARDQWIGVVTDQIYRCARCGQPISNPVKISRSGRWIVLYLECPIHGLKDPKRHILDIIYPMVQILHQNPSNAPGAPPTFRPPPSGAPSVPSPPPPSDTPHTLPPPPPPPPPPPSAHVVPSPPYNMPYQTDSSEVIFCSDCGAALQPGALFCVVCGAEINKDEYDDI